MRKLTYWIADCVNDSPCYSKRARTRKDLKDTLFKSADEQYFEKPRKVVIEYEDAFDLMNQLLQEGGAEYRK